ncbi:MAG TPA: hypothetical protein VHZ95_08170, partial [Polyangiales bacterium]|nr:hypothetical protein [Polyangiales bacterium]
AEASLRTGATQRSLAYFELALARSQPGFERAHVRGRIAWIHHFDSDADACWRTLEAALAEFGHTVPTSDSLALLAAAGERLVRSLVPPIKKLRREEAEILCELYAACVRVFVESGRPARGLASVIRMTAIARRLPPCRAVVQSDLLLAFALSSMGPSRFWKARFARAETMANALADPIAQTLCLQFHHVILGWLGDFKASEREGRICVETRGQYMELGELCHMCFGMYGLEIALGRPQIALWWTEQAIEWVRRSGRAPAMFALIEDAARSTLTALGREAEAEALERRLRFVERARLQEGSYFDLLSYQSRMQRLTERAELGEQFEHVVAKFDALALDPKQQHLLVVIYYVHVAHGRVHQCLRAGENERAPLLPKLLKALKDLDAATRAEVALAHTLVVRAAYCWFTGDQVGTERALVAAERSAENEGCVWVSYAAARLRAHMLRARGNEQAALDQARVAEGLARHYSLWNRLRFIREEFGLSEPAPARTRSDVDIPASTRRHLDALIHIGQANSRELDPELSARMILDELLQSLGAERAFLFMRELPESAIVLRAARRSGGEDLGAHAEYDRRL